MDVILNHIAAPCQAAIEALWIFCTSSDWVMFEKVSYYPEHSMYFFRAVAVRSAGELLCLQGFAFSRALLRAAF